MFHKGIILLFLSFSISVLEAKAPKHQISKDDLKKPDPSIKLEQGNCLEGWVDGSSVGLGCILADITDMGTGEVSSDTICR